MSGYVTAWAVSSGSYSDYRVHAVFATKAQAEAASKLPGWRGQYAGYDVEEFLLYPAGAVAEQMTEHRRMQDLWDDGTEGQLNVSEETSPEFDMLYGIPPKRPAVRFVRAPVHNGKGGRLEVRGSNRKAVEKAFHDRYMQWKAEHT